MPGGTTALPLFRRERPWSARSVAAWLPVWSSPAAVRAVRAAVVMPGLFAFTDKVVGNLQMATFAAFGSFATLVLAGFAGSRKDKLIAHSVLAVTGSVLLTIGTVVSGSTIVAAVVTALVTFPVFFAGVAGANAASGVTAALLAYVLPAASPGTIAMVPDRLAGWWLASVVGTAAVVLVSGSAPSDGLRQAASRVASVLAEQIEAMLNGEATEGHLAHSIDAKRQLLARFTASPARPTGLAVSDQAIANAVEVLEWCTALVADSAHELGDLRQGAPADREVLQAAAAVLRDAASLFAGGNASPDLELLDERCKRAVARLHTVDQNDDFRAQAQLAFHAHAIGVTALTIAADALLAARRAGADWMMEQRGRWFAGATLEPPAAGRLRGAWSSYAGVALRNASVRSVWFVNSARGAVALAVAVAVADLSSVQHGFWVVLGTLSVLRTTAASTGSTALRAFAGTVVGFVIGGALIVAIGSTSTALWAALPVAVLVAAYAPGTAPIAVGQAAFTVTVAILFNLLVPVGWRVGVVRLEDVAIGCAVSVVVGALLWPRGAAAVVGNDLADAYRSGASYLIEAVEWVCGTRTGQPDGAARAVTAGLRLDDALRGFLAEQGTKHLAKEELWRLVGGSLRLRLTAHAVAGLPRDTDSQEGAMRADLERRTKQVHGWYEHLAAEVGKPRRQVPMTLRAPQIAELDTPDRFPGSVIWLTEHLDHLEEHLAELVQPALHLAEVRRRPWWR